MIATIQNFCTKKKLWHILPGASTVYLIFETLILQDKDIQTSGSMYHIFNETGQFSVKKLKKGSEIRNIRIDDMHFLSSDNP